MSFGHRSPLLSLVIATAMASAQAPPPQERPATFAASANLVEVDVVVQKDGKPVQGLTAEDFELYEDGKRRPIESFSEQMSRGTTSGAPERALAAGEFSNHVAGRVPTVIVIDRLNTGFQEQAQTKAQIVAFLGQIQPEDRVALYVIESASVRVLHDFTRDASALLRALERHKSRDTREHAGAEDKTPRTNDPDFDPWIADADERVKEQYLEDRVRLTGRAFQAIAGRLAGFPGRKNLIWISSGFPTVIGGGFGTQTVMREVDGASRAVNRANIAVYPVDARGLIGAFATAISSLPSAPDSARATRDALTTLATVSTNTEAMQRVADSTGGRLFQSTNDIASAIRRATEDSRSSYLLGFAPASGEWDGKLHQIRVKPKRGGLDVRHRSGYWATTARRQQAPATRRDAILEAMQSGLEATGIGVRAQVHKIAAEPGVLGVAIRLDSGAVTLEKVGPKWEGSLDVSIAQKLNGGTLFKNLETTVELSLTSELRERLAREGLVVNRKVPLQEGALRLTIAVRDVATGRLGSVSIPADSLGGVPAR